MSPEQLVSPQPRTAATADGLPTSQTPPFPTTTELEAIARPIGEAPLPGGHLGRVGMAFQRLQTPHAGVKICAAIFFVVFVELPFLFYLLANWTRAHPNPSRDRAWLWLTRLMAFPAAISLSCSNFWSLFPTGSEMAGPWFVVAFGATLMVSGTVAAALTLEGIWRLQGRLLRDGLAARKLHRTRQVTRLRLGMGIVVFLGVMAILAFGILSTQSIKTFLFLWVLGDLLTGLWAKVTLYQAARAITFRKLPQPELPQPLPGGEALAKHTGLSFREVDGLFAAQGTVHGRLVRVVVDPSTDPALLGVTVAVPGLDAAAPGLVLQTRAKDGPPGLPLSDMILDRLVDARCDQPAVVQPLVGGLHEPLLAVLQGWPGSRVGAGEIQLKGTVDLGKGTERVGSQRGIDEAVADALALGTALETALATLS